jgi:glucan phosphoethanolaminetransferase (alkaline phosphatase superfamily)
VEYTSTEFDAHLSSSIILICHCRILLPSLFVCALLTRVGVTVLGDLVIEAVHFFISLKVLSVLFIARMIYQLSNHFDLANGHFQEIFCKYP